jgi:hypothetical protein
LPRPPALIALGELSEAAIREALGSYQGADRAAQALWWRYGSERLRYAEIAARFGVTRQRAQQIVKLGLQALNGDSEEVKP